MIEAHLDPSIPDRMHINFLPNPLLAALTAPPPHTPKRGGKKRNKHLRKIEKHSRRINRPT